MDEIFLSLREHFGSSQSSKPFEELIERRAAVNAESVKAYCSDCIAVLESLDPTDSIDSEKALLLLDSVLILSGPNVDIQKLLKLYCSIGTEIDLSLYPTEFPGTKLAISASTVPVIADPTVKEFTNSRQKPFVSTEIMSSWAALNQWKNPHFWLRLAGKRYFPVEIGTSYLEADWSQDFIQLKAYLDSFVFSSSSKIAYIAQHNWSYQLPELKDDFEVPELGDLFLSEALSEVMIHFWFGMAGTVTPLHFDKYDNFFCQVVGAKRVILVSPEYSSILSDSSNTCTVTGSALESLLKTFPHEIVTVAAGQTLFIPKGWWHQVQSLTFSISLSFWF